MIWFWKEKPLNVKDKGKLFVILFTWLFLVEITKKKHLPNCLIENGFMFGESFSGLDVGSA